MATVRHTSSQLKKMESQTDWGLLEKVEDGNIDYSDAPDVSVLLAKGEIRRVGRPAMDRPKKLVTMRLDQDVVDGLKSTGRNWSTRVNGVLKEYLAKIGVQ